MASIQAQAAKAIRAELKRAFPSVTFKVTSTSFAGGDAVDISYTDGVPDKVVSKIVSKYQYGRFDFMDDMYKSENRREDITQVKFVQVHRHLSPETQQQVKAQIAERFGIQNPEDEQEWRKVFQCWSDQVVWKEVQNMSFV